MVANAGIGDFKPFVDSACGDLSDSSCVTITSIISQVLWRIFIV